MRLRLAVPEGLHKDDAGAILDAALESVTRAAGAQIRNGLAPTFEDGLARHGFRWRPEPPGDEHFDLPTTVIGRGWGDCDDLAPWHAASLRHTGEDPGAAAVVYPSGPSKWHAVVERSDGSIQDPSRAAGMGAVNGDIYGGPFWPRMFGERLSLAAQPLRDGRWAGRVDAPDEQWPFAWSGVDMHRSPALAVAGAIESIAGIACCGEQDLMRLAGLHDILVGKDVASVGAALEQYGGCSIDSLIPAAASLSSPILARVARLLPGEVSMREAQTPGTTLSVPGGPVLVRF